MSEGIGHEALEDILRAHGVMSVSAKYTIPNQWEVVVKVQVSDFYVGQGITLVDALLMALRLVRRDFPL